MLKDENYSLYIKVLNNEQPKYFSLASGNMQLSDGVKILFQKLQIQIQFFTDKKGREL
jgi:hypothetical protein